MDGGQLKGPLPTESVLQLIRESVLTGREMISRYPNGQWQLITREPEFYDSLMEALEGAVRSDNRKTHKNMAEETIFMPPPPSSEPKPLLEPVKSLPVVATPAAEPPAPFVPASQKEPKIIVDLHKFKSFEKDEVLKALRGPVGIVSLILIAAALFFIMGSSEPPELKISLLAPGKAGAPLSQAEITERYKKVIAHVERDTFEDYLEAQNKLVTLVEGAPGNLEIRAVLCLVYKELWPYAKQDTADQKVITSFTQSTRVLDVTSPFGGICEAVKLITGGRYREARGSVENILETSESFSMRPVVYAFKAELLEAEKDYTIAAPYFEKAAQDWQAWVRPRVRLGYVYLALRDYPKAFDWFRAVTNSYPDHKVAQIGAAFAEATGFKQYDNAVKRLSTTLHSKRRAPRNLESEAWEVYGSLLADRGQKRDALAAAEKAYHLNPNNDQARQLVVRLGGSDRLSKDKNQNNELIFLGDQYVRQGDCLSAQAEFKAAFELNNKNGMAALKAAKCLWQLNQSFEAIEWLNKAIRADSKLIPAYVLQADYFSQRYDFESAQQALATAARISANNHEVLRGMSLLEFRKNNMVGAVTYAQRAMKAYDADIETYILLSKSNLMMAMGINSTLRKEIERKDNAYRDALRYANKAIEYDSTNPDAQITYARMLAATNGTDSGAEYLQGLIKKYAYSFEYRLALADIYREAERWSDSRTLCEQVAEADSRNKKAWLCLGESMRATGFNDKALKAFLNAAVIDPTDGEALFQAGKLYFESSRFDEALQQFNRVRTMNPHFPRANYYAGKAAFALGRFDDAVKFALEEKRINPNLADSYLLTAEIYSAQNAFSQCASEYARAIKLRPSGAEIYVKAAQCYRQAGSLEIAGTMLALAMERENGYPELYKETGALFEKKNEIEEALRAYYKYLELAPNAPDKRDIEGRVRRLGGRI